MKKFTEEQIIKASECCKIGNCDDCPFYGVKEDYKVEFPEYALDLINRQKVENERLKQIIDEQDKEIIKLQKRIIFWREDLNYQPEKIKSEAIKKNLRSS